VLRRPAAKAGTGDATGDRFDFAKVHAVVPKEAFVSGGSSARAPVGEGQIVAVRAVAVRAGVPAVGAAAVWVVVGNRSVRLDQ
jgi:hypothetical protein